MGGTNHQANFFWNESRQKRHYLWWSLTSIHHPSSKLLILRDNLDFLVLTYIFNKTQSGWWLSPTPLKNDGVSWDDDIPNMMGKSYKIERFQTTNQPKNVNPQLVTPQQRASFRTSLVSSGLPACRWSFPHGYSHDIPIIDGAHRWFVFMKQWWIWKIPVQKISFWAGECKCNIDSKIWKH